MSRGSTTSIAFLLVVSSCSTATPVRGPTQRVESAAGTLGDEYPGPAATSAFAGVGGQADGLAEELIGDLAAWDASDHEGRMRAAASVETKYGDFQFAYMERLANGARTREVAVFRKRRLLHHEEFVLVPGWIQGGTTRTVRVRPVLVSRREICRESWDRIMSPDANADGAIDASVRGVSWSDAARFCMRAHLELPTEAEWEHAFRAGEPGGLSAADRLAAGWTSTRERPAAPNETSGPVNGLGLKDAAGGVWELTELSHAEGVVASGGAPSGAARMVVKSDDSSPDVGLRPIFRLRGPYPYPAERR